MGDIAEDFLEDFQGDYRTLHQLYQLTLQKVVFFLANCGGFVQCFRTGISVSLKILKALTGTFKSLVSLTFCTLNKNKLMSYG